MKIVHWALSSLILSLGGLFGLSITYPQFRISLLENLKLWPTLEQNVPSNHSLSFQDVWKDFFIYPDFRRNFQFKISSHINVHTQRTLSEEQQNRFHQELTEKSSDFFQSWALEFQKAHPQEKPFTSFHQLVPLYSDIEWEKIDYQWNFTPHLLQSLGEEGPINFKKSYAYRESRHETHQDHPLTPLQGRYYNFKGGKILWEIRNPSLGQKGSLVTVNKIFSAPRLNAFREGFKLGKTQIEFIKFKKLKSYPQSQIVTGNYFFHYVDDLVPYKVDIHFGVSENENRAPASKQLNPLVLLGKYQHENHLLPVNIEIHQLLWDLKKEHFDFNSLMKIQVKDSDLSSQKIYQIKYEITKEITQQFAHLIIEKLRLRDIHLFLN